MYSRSKKFMALLTKINSELNEIISSINSQKPSLFCHSIIVKINNDSKVLNFYLNDILIKEKEIKIEQYNLNDLIRKLIEIINKIHFYNHHIRMIILEDKSNFIFLDIPSKGLTKPTFSEVLTKFGDYYEGKQLTKENILYKKFEKSENNYKIKFDLCFIYHNFSNCGTFDLLIYEDRKYNLNLSRNENIINDLKLRMNFDLSEDNSQISFNKLKDNSISLFIFGNYNYTISESDTKCDINNIISDFILDCINSINEEFYERIKVFSTNKKMNFYFNNIYNCLKEIYTSTNDQEIYDVYSKLFEPVKNDPQYIHKLLAKNFILCSKK